MTSESELDISSGLQISKINLDSKPGKKSLLYKR